MYANLCAGGFQLKAFHLIKGRVVTWMTLHFLGIKNATFLVLNILSVIL